MKKTDVYEFENETPAPAESMSEFEMLLNEQTSWAGGRRYKPGDQVTGTVIQVGKEFVLVDLGGKTAAVITHGSFSDAQLPLPKVGEDVTAFVKSDNGSEVHLTKSISRKESQGGLLKEAFQTQMPIDGKVEKVNKGGFEISIAGQRAFCPMGHMDLATISEPEKWIGASFSFVVMEYKQNGRNIVVSRRPLLKAEQETKKQQVVAELQAGQSRQATITRLAPFGAFADLGGIEGLIPMGELSLKRVNKPEDVVKVGESVTVRVLKVEFSPKIRIALSLKDGGSEGIDQKVLKEFQDKQEKEFHQAPREMTSTLALAFSKANHRNKR